MTCADAAEGINKDKERAPAASSIEKDPQLVPKEAPRTRSWPGKAPDTTVDSEAQKEFLKRFKECCK